MIQPQPDIALMVPLVHHWRVDAHRSVADRAVTEYAGHDVAMATRTVGKLCMDTVVDRVLVFRDGEEYRRIEVKP